jgi:hypothetical protein
VTTVATIDTAQTCDAPDESALVEFSEEPQSTESLYCASGVGFPATEPAEDTFGQTHHQVTSANIGAYSSLDAANTLKSICLNTSSSFIGASIDGLQRASLSEPVETVHVEMESLLAGMIDDVVEFSASDGHITAVTAEDAPTRAVASAAAADTSAAHTSAAHTSAARNTSAGLAATS